MASELERPYQWRYGEQDSADHGDDLVFTDPRRGTPLHRTAILERFRDAPNPHEAALVEAAFKPPVPRVVDGRGTNRGTNLTESHYDLSASDPL